MQRDTWGKWAMAIALGLIIVAGVAMILSVSQQKTPLSIGGQLVYARVANTDQERLKGLSGTSGLGEKEAMLFIFPVPGRWGIWMKDMNYSLDIAWLDGDKKIIYMAQNVAPQTFPKVFLPDKEALYVVELPAGFIAKHEVSVGQAVGFTEH